MTLHPLDGLREGAKVIAPAFPPRTRYRRPVTVTGVVKAVTPAAIVLATPGGFRTVKEEEARVLRAQEERCSPPSPR